MKASLRYSVLACLLLFVLPAEATTYFIDYAGGSNANNGLLTGAAWKTHPYMQTGASCTGTGSAPSYSHVAGDIFKFKGGETWPNACFSATFTAGGASGSVDYYGVDATWYTGGSWTRPIFAAGGARITLGAANNFLNLQSNSYITFDNIEFDGMHWTNADTIDPSMISTGTGTNITVSNCYFHNWTHASEASGVTTDLKVLVGNSSPATQNHVVTNNIFDGSPNGTTSGMAVYQMHFASADNNIVRNMANGFLYNIGSVIHHNTIGPINVSFLAGGHANCLEQVAGGGTAFELIYSNKIFDCSQVTIITGQRAKLWNNVMWSTGGADSPVMIGIDNYDGPNTDVYIFNNTLIPLTGFPCINVGFRGGGPTNTLDMRNNLCISSTVLYTIYAGSSVTNLTDTTNVVITQATATAQGYTTANSYIPTTLTDASVNVGTDISAVCPNCTTDYSGSVRPQGAAWDVGYVEWVESGSGAIATLSLSAVTCPNARPGITTACTTVTLQNTGDATLTITSITLSAGLPFAQSNDCGATLAAAASCTITLTFTPGMAGAATQRTLTVDTTANDPTCTFDGTGLTIPASMGVQ